MITNTFKSKAPKKVYVPEDGNEHGVENIRRGRE
jgi:hypothetical protein